MNLFKNDEKSENIEAKINAFDEKTGTLEAERERLLEQKSNALAREAAGDDTAGQELGDVRKKLKEVDESLEGRDSAREQLQQALRDVRKREELTQAEASSKELEQTLAAFEGALDKIEKSTPTLLKQLSEMRNAGAHLRIGSSFDQLNPAELVRHALGESVRQMKHYTDDPEKPLVQLRERLSSIREQARQAPAAEYERRRQQIESKYGGED